MIELFASAFVLGLAFNAAPGSIFAESLRRGLRGGFGSALAVQVGSLVGDFTWAVLGLLGAAALFTLSHVEVPLALAGAALLAWMAWQAIADGLGPMPAFDERAGSRLDRSALVSGAALSLSNPMNVTYWAALGGTITALGVDRPGWEAFTVFLAGFMASSLLWCFLCAGLIAWTRRHLGPTTWRLINLGCALGLAFFSALVVWRIASA
ncbi:LysE family translocator [Azospirillum canadense]|uniref:LysE family translocator n=1 Tax=Azospirillum canadense TaxID=403962 RepID=UPI002226DC8B|nr:LysE family translocator [Azospirillum canadense]MCW2240685.1 threonine/homoserine/homoserine lactone efflux protein [Azospirillum canadense]